MLGLVTLVVWLGSISSGRPFACARGLGDRELVGSMDARRGGGETRWECWGMEGREERGTRRRSGGKRRFVAKGG